MHFCSMYPSHCAPQTILEKQGEQILNFCKKLKAPAAAPSELRVLEHLKHGVEHGQHDHIALHQPASVHYHGQRLQQQGHLLQGARLPRPL